ncbi:hypothetical protein BGX23_002467 [Mortierella sp. AD031]|nr:hypothetical protein BGX23_002467 [Mortierella sp. AD031]
MLYYMLFTVAPKEEEAPYFDHQDSSIRFGWWMGLEYGKEIDVYPFGVIIYQLPTEKGSNRTPKTQDNVLARKTLSATTNGDKRCGVSISWEYKVRIHTTISLPALRHPDVVEAEDSFEVDEFTMADMERCHQGSLDNVIDDRLKQSKDRKWPESEAALLLAQVIDAFLFFITGAWFIET